MHTPNAIFHLDMVTFTAVHRGLKKSVIICCNPTDNVSTCRAMSNDLDLPNNANKVLRTYSNNYSDPSSPQRGDMHNNSMRVHTIKHLTKEEKEELVMQMSVAQSVSIPMPGQMER